VKLEGALLAAALARVTPDRVHGALGALAAAAIGAAGHQRAPVRVLALSALDALVPLGGEALPVLLAESVIPALRGVRFDRTPSVRRELGRLSARWLGALPPWALKARGAEAALTAIVLALCADESPDVQESTLSA
jgi:hypothetical protein